MRQNQSMLKASTSLFLFCFLLSSIVWSADRSDERIIFLTLKFDQSSVQLVDSKIVLGHLKTNRGQVSGEISFELLGDTTILFEGAIDNPLVRRLEYEDPDNAGKLKTKVVTLASATISLRVPYSAKIKQLIFYRIQETGSSDSKTARSVLGVVDLTTVHRGER